MGKIGNMKQKALAFTEKPFLLFILHKKMLNLTDSGCCFRNPSYPVCPQNRSRHKKLRRFQPFQSAETPISQTGEREKRKRRNWQYREFLLRCLLLSFYASTADWIEGKLWRKKFFSFFLFSSFSLCNRNFNLIHRRVNKHVRLRNHCLFERRLSPDKI